MRRPNAWKLGIKGRRFIDGNRDALALAATSANQFDPDDPWILVIAPTFAPESDSNSNSQQVCSILRLLGEMKLRITFISDFENYSPHQEILERGSLVVRGFDAGRSHLAETGGKYHFVLLFEPKAAFWHLPYVRAYAPYSKVIYQMAGRQLNEVSAGSTLSDKASELRRFELLNAVCADLVLVGDEEEKDNLLAAQPKAKAVVLPNLAINYCDSGTKKRWADIFNTNKDKLSRNDIQG